MTEDKNTQEKDLDNVCDECKKVDESVTQNLILIGFKICKSCRISKTIFSYVNLLLIYFSNFNFLYN